MSAERLWWLAFASLAATVGCALATGSSNLTLAAAIIAYGVVVLALIVDAPPREGRRKPW